MRYLTLILLILVACKTAPNYPQKLSVNGNFDCSHLKGTERNNCIREHLKELESITNPQNPIKKTKSITRLDSTTIKVEREFQVSRNLKIKDIDTEEKRTFWHDLKTHVSAIGIGILIGLFI